ncbi:phenylalanine--tRNA ligase subunit beta [Halomonas sp. 18H]|uniref:phenylalanine--tRNA ligase subunit beta n=1 Tax=Halomonas almeriensis TaxID=308163 RepID=UPI00222FB047|nr:MULTISPECIES: phenylalanine--tRNA ligase subunit beta [Halomonas]MCW4151804.1 phenylalanine--tRNA ligase subunit beta [Halomonas sp. 18H]MDN3554050.1 phenylalanine--tRNA ligase subunit beta [Halomonas almeriensis]
MKFSEQWLREWVSPALTTQQLADQVTMAGLEVDGIEPVAAAFTGVVVAEVTELAPHPDADKLSVCQVNDGVERLQVVCGAPNVAQGQKIAFARVGAVLPAEDPKGFRIKKAKLRGVESRGMICSASELGLDQETSAGILVLPDDAPVGDDVRDYLTLDDSTIEVDLTPNRGDCLSIQGMAREVGVLNRLPVAPPPLDPVEARHDETFPVRIEAEAGCPRYLGRVIRNVDVTAPTPLWMVERLRRGGVRSIDPVVDVTNYVMLELGQPLHAFDRDNLHDAIVVRHARHQEPLTLLDGQKVALSEDTLVIADARGPLAIAGVMGGEHSGVHQGTRDIFLEAAHFSPLAIAGQARHYGLHTDASHRFERGVDPQRVREAAERATALLVEITGGQPGPLTEAVAGEADHDQAEVLLRRGRLDQALDKVLAEDEVSEILQRLGITVSSVAQGWQARVPSWRFDIAIEEDLIEEIARIHGYNQLPSRPPRARLGPRPDNEATHPLASLRRRMVSRGYFEAVTYSFVAPELQTTLLPDAVSPALANPISNDLSVMRASLFPGLIRALQHNLNRQQPRVRLFETGLVFRGPLDDLEQVPMLGALVCGKRDPEGWHGDNAPVDFFDLKGDLESLMELGEGARAWSFVAAEHPSLHPGQSARVLHQGQPVGWIGKLHPAVRAQLGLKVDALLFEVELEALSQGRIPAFKPLSRFPEVRRDLAFLVDAEKPVQDLLDILEQEAGEWLVDAHLFDVYQGQGVPEGRKSIALGLTWQHPSRTLNDEEINQLVESIVMASRNTLGAELRT